jgi:cytosine/adenosine deaminase-related metal-dependent hydrolase
MVGLVRIISADWIFPPGEAPIEKGAVLMHGTRILDLGSPADLRAEAEGARELSFEGCALVPGLVNCHTHLEFATINRLPAQDGFAKWIRALLDRKSEITEEKLLNGAERALIEMTALGTAYVGDVSSTTATSLALIRTGMPGTVFREFLGFDGEALEAFDHSRNLFGPEELEGVRILPACHASYSTSPELFRAVGEWSAIHECPTMVHLAESKDELELLARGKGPLKALLADRGIPDDKVPAPGSDPVTYLEELKFLSEQTVAVHLTQATEKDLKKLKELGVTPCICPSSNQHLVGKLPPVRAMIDLGMKPCLGTDSPASGESLSLFREMEILLDEGLPAEIVLAMGTRYGQEALQLPADYGCLEQGSNAALLAIPLDMNDCEDPLESALRAGAKGCGTWVVTPQGAFGTVTDELEESDIPDVLPEVPEEDD